MSRRGTVTNSLQSISESLNKLAKTKQDVLNQIDERIKIINELIKEGNLSLSSETVEELDNLYKMRETALQDLKKDEIKQEIKDYNLVKNYNKMTMDKVYITIYNYILEYFGDDKRYPDKKRLYSVFKDNSTMFEILEELNIQRHAETIKTYQKALEDVYKLYKYQIQAEEKEKRELERMIKEKERKKLQNDIAFIGFFTGLNHFIDRLNKKR